MIDFRQWRNDGPDRPARFSFLAVAPSSPSEQLPDSAGGSEGRPLRKALDAIGRTQDSVLRSLMARRLL